MKKTKEAAKNGNTEANGAVYRRKPGADVGALGAAG
jgi:hypothetical protein